MKLIKREVSNGITTLHTDDGRTNGCINKLGVQGVSQIKYSNRYRVDIAVGREHKYSIGVFDTLTEAVQARKIAEMKREDKTLVEWKKTIPDGHSKLWQAFWQKEFKKYAKVN